MENITINYNGLHYSVEETKEEIFDENTRLDGQIKYGEHKINISGKAPIDEQSKKSTLLHELVHMIVFENQLKGDIKDEENTGGLARGLYSLLSENEKLLDMFYKE